ncbi:unnamed protein product [Vicia faba]|uniref:Uncharacterized protein n=1 Tax=Vicia faba TaxID=3906 RepID=A0AAV0ZUI0_VICFA|nr:unnamed protein product [Vicia faba]
MNAWITHECHDFDFVVRVFVVDRVILWGFGFPSLISRLDLAEETDEGSRKNVGEMANVSKIQRFHGLGFALMVCLRNMESAQVKTSTSFNSSFGMAEHQREGKLQLHLAKMEPVSFNRILLETDAPDALPNSNIYSLFFVEGDTSLAEEIHGQRITSSSTSDSSPANFVASEFATGVAEEVDLQLSFCSGCGISEICIVGKQVALVLKTFLTNIKYVGYIRINYCNQSGIL